MKYFAVPLFGSFNTLLLLLKTLLLSFRGQGERGSRNALGEKRVKPRFIDVVEKGRQLVVLPLRQGVVLMCMAAATFKCQAEHRRGDRLCSIRDIFNPKLFGHASAFDLLRMQTIKGRRQNLLACGVGKQIARQLLGQELIVWQVAVEGVDHPVPPGPNETVPIDLVTI